MNTLLSVELNELMEATITKLQLLGSDSVQLEHLLHLMNVCESVYLELLQKQQPYPANFVAEIENEFL